MTDGEPQLARQANRRFAEQDPGKVRELRSRINDLAGGMAKSLLPEELFKDVVKQVKGRPLALPNEDSLYEDDVSGD
jgi:hypothetical protein